MKQKAFLSYSSFRVGPTTEHYPLFISRFEGGTDDSFYTAGHHSAWSLNLLQSIGTMISGFETVQCIIMVVMTVDGSTITALLYTLTTSMETGFLCTSMVSLKLSPFRKLKIRPQNCNI